MQKFDDETSNMVCGVLEWCIKELATSKDEVRQTHDRNKDVFASLTESDKQRLRQAWAAAFQRLEN